MKLRPKFIRKKQNDVISAPVTPPIKQPLPDYYAQRNEKIVGKFDENRQEKSRGGQMSFG